MFRRLCHTPAVMRPTLIAFPETRIPDPPPIVREPMRLGSTVLPSRFFLAPMAGYTTFASRLAVRKLGGLELITTDLVNARAILEKRPRSFELAETCLEDRPISIQ